MTHIYNNPGTPQLLEHRTLHQGAPGEKQLVQMPQQDRRATSQSLEWDCASSITCAPTVRPRNLDIVDGGADSRHAVTPCEINARSYTH